MVLKKIREGKLSKVIASYLSIQLLLQVTDVNNLYALTSGPSQPEFNSFTPIGTSDMVDLSSGDFNYNIAVMDVGGYPLNLAYNAGVSMDQEASWVGLGWNMNVGQINRQVRGLPDDFKGDEMIYENHQKKNITAGATFDVNAQILGLELLQAGVGLTVESNNYEGISAKFTYNAALSISDNVSVGVNLSSSATEGASVNPRISLSSKGISKTNNFLNGLNASFGIGYNSRQGLSNFNMSASSNLFEKDINMYGKSSGQIGFGLGGSGSVSYATKTFTPQKRTAYNNLGVTFDFSAGGDFWGIDGEVGLTAYGSVQSLRAEELLKTEKAYGYDFTEFGSINDVLDFNRENDRVLNKNAKVLPILNYTHDLYSIKGQGVSGMFRPFRGQVGFLFDKFVRDRGFSANITGEVEIGNGGHGGGGYRQTISKSHTGLWSTVATNFFTPSTTNEIDYERVYFKQVGDLRVDNESEILEQTLGGNSPIALQIKNLNPLTTVGGFDNYAANIFDKKVIGPGGIPITQPLPITSKIKRTHREKRNQSIQKINAEELADMGFNNLVNPNAKPHHTAAIKVLKPDGSTYVFSETAYNTKKEEVTFAVNNSGNCTTGLVTYNNGENSAANGSGFDNYFNRTTTPEYAHTYLLSGVMSSDYEDITNNGPTDDDLGSYTKFIYENKNPSGGTYNWRIPYGSMTASYNGGLNTNTGDEKGNYVYGEKELKYIKKVETKTHVAYFDLSPRQDGYGVNDFNGAALNSVTNSKMYKLDKVYLFTKPEYNKLTNNEQLDWDTIDSRDKARTAIKIAHFEYDYSLCENVLNNDLQAPNSENTLDNQGGKLTLKKVFFTYRGSNMGKYTPYKFNYDTFNPNYELKAYDVWGNFKPSSEDALSYTADAQGNIVDVDYTPSGALNCGTQEALTAPEFPFVQQENKSLQDHFATAWSLSSIELPSGGKLEIELEADDYGYVQDKKAMSMVKVVGTSTDGTSFNNQLYAPNTYGSGESKYIVVETKEDFSNDVIGFKEAYLGEHLYKPIYFQFFLNMTKNAAQSQNSHEYDYVRGYFKIDNATTFQAFNQNGKNYVAIPMQWSDMEGGINGGAQVNPISKAGWYFGRRYLNRQTNGLPHDPNEQNVETIARSIISSLGAISELFSGPNGRLRNKFHVAKVFNPDKSWIRLRHDGDKFGGGCRVKRIQLNDQWSKMLALDESNQENLDRYQMKYGQEYSYAAVDENGIPQGSSGIATFEPNSSKENPFVEPFFDSGERLTAPAEVNYVEKPLGVSFYPSPTVTYGRVEVKNLSRERTETNNQGDTSTLVVKKHATGKVVNEFYTSKDFPTRADQTIMPLHYASNENNVANQVLAGLVGLKVRSKTELNLSQGFVVETNDMNGKNKSQQVYNEHNEFISGVNYKYSTSLDDNTRLNNNLPVVNSDGSVSNDHTIGRHYDAIVDFRDSFAQTSVFGINGNVAGFVVGIFPVIIPAGFPERSDNKRILHTTTTTKVIHNTGIMIEKEAIDLNSRVATKNLAWDAETGDVLLTETTNEFDDRYYNFSYPVHWGYESMGLASNNLSVEGILGPISNNFYTVPNPIGGTSRILHPGDILLVEDVAGRVWVVEENTSGAVKLIDDNGAVLTDLEDKKFKVMRSGFKNQQSGGMASVTTQVNPLDTNNDGVLDEIRGVDHWDNLKVVNASAVNYIDLWNSQCEYRLPKPISNNNIDDDGNIIDVSAIGFNPYLYNVKGEWRANKSYAYLTARNNGTQGFHPREEGFFDTYIPYYEYQASSGWGFYPSDNATKKAKQDKWTFASEVTQYSPYGAEVENRDALNRYSAAQYGYSFTLPMAVGSNTRYKELAYDGFEDYEYGDLGAPSADDLNPHFSFKDALDGTNTAVRTDETSHTGRYSIKLNPQSDVAIGHRVVSCEVDADEDKGFDAIDDNLFDCADPGEIVFLDVLNNDLISNINAINITVQPSIGNVIINDNGTPGDVSDDAVSYKVLVTGEHTISFMYKICDSNGSCDEAKVNLTICPKL